MQTQNQGIQTEFLFFAHGVGKCNFTQICSQFLFQHEVFMNWYLRGLHEHCLDHTYDRSYLVLNIFTKGLLFWSKVPADGSRMVMRQQFWICLFLYTLKLREYWSYEIVLVHFCTAHWFQSHLLYYV
jgi:hypothetical protein